MNLKSEDIIKCNACHAYNGELYEGWREGCDDLVFRAGAEESLKVKEGEMRKKALQCYCLDSCLVHDVNDRDKILSCCNEECPIVARFIKNLKADRL